MTRQVPYLLQRSTFSTSFALGEGFGLGKSLSHDRLSETKIPRTREALQLQKWIFIGAPHRIESRSENSLELSIRAFISNSRHAFHYARVQRILPLRARSMAFSRFSRRSDERGLLIPSDLLTKMRQRRMDDSLVILSKAATVHRKPLGIIRARDRLTAFRGLTNERRTIMSFLAKSAAIFGGYKGMRGGMKAAAAIAAGRWVYNKWQSSRTQNSPTSQNR